MRKRRIHFFHPMRRLLFLTAALAGAGGCGPSEQDRLVVATCWPRALRIRMESEFRAWLATSQPGRARAPVSLEWLVLGTGDDMVRLADRRDAPDVLLGGRGWTYLRLASARRLAPIPGAGSAFWLVARRGSVRLTSGTRPQRAPHDGNSSPLASSEIAFDDPRVDPISLAWAESLLEEHGFRDGYSRLVGAAGYRRRIGRRAGSAQAAADRGEADLAVRRAYQEPPEGDRGKERAGEVSSAGERERAFLPGLSPAWVEGAAMLRTARNPLAARLFLGFLTEACGMTPAGEAAAAGLARDPDLESLIADLLGATLVDAQDELWQAWSALQRAGYPDPPLRLLTEPPPWPPASIEKLQRQNDRSASGLMETLAREIAPAPPVRAALVRSWLSPPRLIDTALLSDLAHTAQGQLVREPRFRSWLKAEWSAWARQRYRRVARVVAGAGARTASK